MTIEGVNHDLTVAIYARQSVDEDQGIQQQLDDCHAEARRRRWHVVAQYSDNDTSGSMERGPGTDWAKMLRAFDAGEFDALLVNDVDRLTRSLTDVLDVRPPKRNMRILAVRGGIDTDDPTGDYMLKQLVLLAEREVKLKAERARRYAIERRKAGHPSPGKPPHGYRWVPAIERDERGTRYAVVEEEARDVRRVFKEFLSGGSLGQIARDLNTAGRRTRTGARWVASTVRRMLMNPMYAALLPPAQKSGEHSLAAIVFEECTPGVWKSLVDRDQVLAARNLLIGVKPNHSGTARRWLLSGLAVCAVCRAPVRSARGETHPTARKDGSGSAPPQRYHAYRCVNGHFMRNGDIIDEYVLLACYGRLTIPDLSAMLAKNTPEVDVGVLDAQRVELEQRDAWIAMQVASGKMKPVSADAALDQIAAELRDVNAKIAQATELDPLAELATVTDVHAWWYDATLARQRLIVDRLMTVAIKPVGPGRRVTTLERAAETVEIVWRERRKA